MFCQLLMATIKNVNILLVHGKEETISKVNEYQVEKGRNQDGDLFQTLFTNAMLSLNGQIECMKLYRSITRKKK